VSTTIARVFGGKTVGNLISFSLMGNVTANRNPFGTYSGLWVLLMLLVVVLVEICRAATEAESGVQVHAERQWL
jgi:hypothetical protein